jgi:hypothetical protein
VRSIVDHIGSYEDHVYVVYTKYLSVKIPMALTANVIVSSKHHYVAMGSFGIDDILRSANIVRRIIEGGSVMVVHAIVLQNN